ncbi:MAG: 30S ribosomal protein S13 [Candidatus Brennerbacteria bacterium CG11_big_fil_rev_8_21_14_0_20_43_10]|uniref:Small ribosomal subunit protein uS13 n=3 Tax=Candidatus Brenneribacteriota TaxID=1817902 RepID=A0A2M8C3S0_9BACT|nr:MAG: 30S ribosomal protein S13 [Parcubacteria group bacterium CG1_02_44_31]PIP50508.1 MAG: 30S ribosomal protein S13 [Candidatus Brennerbacteria bacterium CG23_combo_of_CG06-09_8_20_14_all_44_41]PIR26594.1 MAG: 30S ribosomal protein S13 [Candidatus Brennerbacteria bacterium CG11_big_fil_rev_8_21_14_0_20_43_10]PIX28863.1 MAG: 30S ribosomal protein S13 [Candidatus Brennerbacteria bacterium CG_4_8_14_3_um_filter_43_14]PJA19613.1 MAG: 30S ribosomal protein S13 [Candidatus Brennerbacteria bacteri
MRIAGVVIPDEKQIDISLRYIFGVGPTRARKIVIEAGISPNTRTKNLTTAEIAKIRDAIEKQYRIEGDLRREIQTNIKRLKDIKCYRGIRHMKRLPVRGQSTKRNARTVRGNVKKLVGSGRKRSASKT